MADLTKAEGELQKLLRQEEEYWKQWSKLFWLSSGDYSTRAFHLYANGRKRKKEIKCLKDSQGNWRDKGQGLQDVVVDYFANLFSNEAGPMEEVLECVESERGTNFANLFSKVSVVQNDELVRPFDSTEVKEAVFGMHLDKSPGEDGLNPGFFQKCWDVVGDG